MNKPKNDMIMIGGRSKIFCDLIGCSFERLQKCNDDTFGKDDCKWGIVLIDPLNPTINTCMSHSIVYSHYHVPTKKELKKVISKIEDEKIKEYLKDSLSNYNEFKINVASEILKRIPSIKNEKERDRIKTLVKELL